MAKWSQEKQGTVWVHEYTYVFSVQMEFVQSSLNCNKIGTPRPNYKNITI